MAKKVLNDTHAFGFTKEALEMFKAPLDDEDLSEDSDLKDRSEDYEDEHFD
jgi:hypothetical protein